MEHKNYIDGVNNPDYWTGKADESAREEYLYYAESRLQAIRINQWKAHFYVRDGYYGHTTKLDIAYVFNDVMDRLARHMATQQKYPPKQKGTSLSLAN